MKKKQSDFIVGVVIFLSIIILLAGIVFLKEIDPTQTKVYYTALFPNIGGLQAGDPVTVNGVKKGVVSNINLHQAEVAVSFKLDGTVPFTDSSTITVKNVGLMGERKIEISLSSKGKPHTPDPEEGTPTNFIRGKFDSGIAEAIGMLGGLVGEAADLLDTVEYIIGATVGDEKFLNFFSVAVDRLDTISLMVDALLGDNSKDLRTIVKDVKYTSKQLKSILTENRKPIKTVIANAQGLTEDADSLITELDSIMARVNSIVVKVDSGNGTIAQLLNNDELSVEIKKTLADLDKLLDQIDSDGLKLRVKLGFGKKK